MTDDLRRQRNAVKLLELHPVFGARVLHLIGVMEAAGYRPRIQQAYRSLEEQQQNLAKGVSEVVWSFHNATNEDGTPAALAVDLLDDEFPTNPRKGYLMRLAIEAAAIQVRTGILWGLSDGPRERLAEAIRNGQAGWVGALGWDPTHCEPSDLSLAQAKHGLRPAA